jgi:hypothetical protein
MNILHFLHPSYYTDSNLGFTFTGFWWVVGVLGALLIAALWVANWIKKAKVTATKRRFYGHLIKAAHIISIGGLVYLFFRYEQITYLNLRLWPLLLALAAIWQIVAALLYKKKKEPLVLSQEAVATVRDIYSRKLKPRKKG